MAPYLILNRPSWCCQRPGGHWIDVGDTLQEGENGCVNQAVAVAMYSPRASVGTSGDSRESLVRR